MKDTNVSRREFIKRALVAGGAVGGLAVAGAGGKVVLDERTRDQVLAGREQQRPTGSISWLVQAEYVALGALAALIVPSNNAGPGAPEAQVVDTIDRLIAVSRSRQGLYAAGLLTFDELAERSDGVTFANLPRGRQESLLETVEARYAAATGGGMSLVDRVERKATNVYHDLDGQSAAVDLFPQLVADVLQAFYTSQVAWTWLGYDGPPQPAGYVGRVDACES